MSCLFGLFFYLFDLILLYSRGNHFHTQNDVSDLHLSESSHVDIILFGKVI